MSALGRAHVFTIITSTFLALPQIVTAQTQSSGPMFSTPASRSTTGAPILNDPRADTDTILNSAGGGNATQTRTTTPPPPQQAQQPTAPQIAAKQEVFGNWAVECADPAQDARRCQITGKTASADQKQTILVLSIASSPDMKTTLYQAALPLGIAVQKKVQISVGEDYKSEIAISRCTQQGCLLEGKLDTPLLEAMKKGAEVKFTVTTPEGSQIPIMLSLGGFSAALAKMSSI